MHGSSLSGTRAKFRRSIYKQSCGFPVLFLVILCDPETAGPRFPNIVAGFTDLEFTAMDRLRSQVLGIILLALVFLLVACIRYYFRLG